MSTETRGLQRRQCDNSDCEKIHDVCPLCGEKVTSYAHFEHSPAEAKSPTDGDSTSLCTEWDEKQLWLYWHER
jgi:hypothetical protein